MILIISLMGGLAVALIGCHMARPRSYRRIISSVLFFRNLPQAEHSQRRWQLSNPFSLPFLARAMVLALLLWALLPWLSALIGAQEGKAIGLWVMIDTSGSLETRENRDRRIDSARKEVKQAVAAAEAESDEGRLCLRLSTFDTVREDLESTTSVETFMRALELVEPRALGTDLSLVAGAVNLGQEDGACAITHFLVVSDQPAPDGLTSEAGPPVIWRSVGTPETNTGFTSIEPVRDLLSGVVTSVMIEVTSYGDAPTPTSILAISPSKAILLDQTLDWQGSAPVRRWRRNLITGSPGNYLLLLTPGGAYPFDDKAEFRVPKGDSLRVDWKLGDLTIPQLLGWNLEPGGQDSLNLRVMAAGAPMTDDNVPSLLVGSGLGDAGQPIPVGYFNESSPLLNDLNFDMVETLRPPLLELPDLPAGFEPVLLGQGKEVWLAQRANPPAAYVPELPDLLGQSNEEAGETISTTLFFNSARWLLERGPLPALYSLTDPAHPEPEGTWLALHPDEGNTFATEASGEPFPPFRPRVVAEVEDNRWPWWLIGALGVFLLERFITAWKGESWI